MSLKKKVNKEKKKKTAMVICGDDKEFWTTQTQFWQWLREGVVARPVINPEWHVR
jgi:hypothetical protein